VRLPRNSAHQLARAAISVRSCAYFVGVRAQERANQLARVRFPPTDARAHAHARTRAEERISARFPWEIRAQAHESTSSRAIFRSHTLAPELTRAFRRARPDFRVI
jgi:hypothetical protein